ncbi:ABC transporter permease [Nocardioides sediminis]|uniref:ABC transporter permease n=1 Tax=Nocardioides sediminis TaxID=433648 RepID=UPI000D32273B|nr:ABC transporter permease [Nocardioides sediminis]
MFKFTVRRLLQMIPVIIGATFLIYWMVFSLPGDPTAGKCGDRPCPDAYVAQFEEEYNLNDPLLVQYGKYMAGVVQGDFGESYYGVPVSEELSERFVVTAKLGLMALGIEAVIGILAGVLAALKKGGFIDNVVLVSTLAVIALPLFVTASVLQLYLGIRWELFPVTVGSDTSFYALLLPAFVLASVSLAYLARLMRTNLSENLGSDYVRTARAKGLPQSRVVGVHTLRNSLIPVVTFLGYDLGALMGGTIVIEGIFNIPGVGNYIYRAINDRDGVVVVGAVTALILVYLFANLVVDLLYGLLDPRISHD